uniref:Secreted protein n=1 Tax=Panstrongylus lignarius TaxID=156445 RepID=A0A224Y3P4_9HEMI
MPFGCFPLFAACLSAASLVFAAPSLPFSPGRAGSFFFEASCFISRNFAQFGFFIRFIFIFLRVNLRLYTFLFTINGI